MYKIYIAPYPTNGFEVKWTCPRGEYIVKSGLQQLPQVELVDSADKANFIFWIYRPHNNHEKSQDIIRSYDSSKLVVIDWTDEPDEMHTDKFLAYFKRSWCFPSTRGLCSEKYSIQRPDNMYPFAYCTLPEFEYKSEIIQNIDVGCYLRQSDPNRFWVLNTLYSILPSIPNIQYRLGPINSASRSNGINIFVSEEYIKTLKQTKIIITCNPTEWEGDSRTWEALANGSLVFVDKMFVPYYKKLIDKEHIIEYNIGNEQDLYEKILYYLSNDVERQKIANNGYKFTKECHTPKARMQYILDIITK